MSQAPHLPPRAAKPERKLKEFLLFVLFTVFLAFSAGIAASAVAFAWLIPPVPTTRSIFTFFQNSQVQNQNEILTVDESKSAIDRIVKVFDKRKKMSGNFYDGNSFFGNATLLTVDGWAVLTAPSLSSVDPTVLEVVDSQGITHAVTKTVVDQGNGLAYIDIEGEGFPVFPLFTGDLVSQKIVWSYKDNHFVETELLFSYPKQKESARNVSSFAFHLTPQTTGPELLVDDKGELIGFADKTGNLISSVEINRQLRFLQKNGTIVFKGLPVSGYVVEATEKDDRGIPVVKYGFVVTENTAKAKVALQVGDIVVKINGEVFDPKTAREQILSAPDEVGVTVLRQGKSVEVKVKKI